MTNVISLNKTISDARLEFRNLLQKLHTLMQKYDNTYGDEDARCEFFVMYFQLNLWMVIQFDSFLEVLDRRSDRVSRYIILTEQDRTQFMAQYDTINRASYCTKAMFEVEHFLNSISKELSLTTHSYRDMIRKLKNKLNLGNDQFNILIAPALIRNSLHNNGFHSKNDFKVVIRGKSYKFEKDKRVMFAGWDNMYIMFDELLDVIEYIIQSPQVMQLSKVPHTSMTYHDTQ